MTTSTQSSSGGIVFTGLLTIVFVIFKLMGDLDWSWWWVFSPLWIRGLVLVAILVADGLIWLIADLFDK